MRAISNAPSSSVQSAAAALLCVSLGLVACSSIPSSAVTRAPASAADEAMQAAEPTPEPTVETATRERERRRRPARLEIVDDYSFTITEAVRISGDVRTDYQNALMLLGRQQFEQGVSLLREVIEAAPDVTAPHINLGIAYGLQGELELAEASLMTALELTPDHPIAHNELGIVYRKTGRFSEARASYQRALDIHPGFHFAHRNLAVLCDLYLADLPCALEHYEIYHEAVPDDDEAAIWIADIRGRLSK